MPRPAFALPDSYLANHPPVDIRVYCPGGCNSFLTFGQPQPKTRGQRWGTCNDPECQFCGYTFAISLLTGVVESYVKP